MKKLIEADEYMKWWFTFTIPDRILYAMNKVQYKATMSWLRLCRRKIHRTITPEFLRG